MLHFKIACDREINLEIFVHLSVKCYRDFPNPDLEADYQI